MSARIPIDALGVPIRLDLAGLTDAEAEAVRVAWRDATLPGAGPREASAEHTIVVREEGDGSPLPHLLERLSQRVTTRAIEARRGEVWMLHAAGLALPDGRVIVLVGPSGRGKTTASRALGAGLGYVSDETVAIDAGGRVLAHRKPLSIIEQPGTPKVQRAPSDLGLGALPGAALRLAAIVLLDRRSDAPDAPVVDVLDFGDALEELVSQTSYLPSLDTPLAMIAGLIAPLGGARRVVYREAATLSSVVDDLVAPVTEAGRWRVPVLLPADGSAGGDGSGFVRTPVRDAVELDGPDRIALLQPGEGDDGVVRLLGGIAPTLWRAASGATRETLVAAAVEAHGRPPGLDAEALVDTALAELIASGVLAEHRPEPVWRIRDDVAWHDSGDRVAVLSSAEPDGQTLLLEGSAALIWRELAAGGTVSDLTSAIADAASIEIADAETALWQFLTPAQELGLVRLS